MEQSFDQEHFLDQLRAKNSLEKSKLIDRKYPDNVKDDYAGYVVRLAGEIRIVGLGQALAQLIASARKNKEDPHYLVYQDLQEWLCMDHPKTPFSAEKDLLDALLKTDRNNYQWAMVETAAWLEWHKKLAVAYLKEMEEKSE